jgi:hypothetical protein
MDPNQNPTSWWNRITPAQAILLVVVIAVLACCVLPWLLFVVAGTVGKITGG